MVAPIRDLLLRSVTRRREDAPSKVSSTWLGCAYSGFEIGTAMTMAEPAGLLDDAMSLAIGLTTARPIDCGRAHRAWPFRTTPHWRSAPWTGCWPASPRACATYRKSLSSQSAYNPLRECGLNIGSAWVESGSLLNGGGTWEIVKDQEMKISAVPGLGRKAGISGPAIPSINLFILPQRIPPILTNLPQRQ